MPISSKTFGSGSVSSNPKLLDFFVQNKAKAYSLTELQQLFGNDVRYELSLLVLGRQLEQKYLRNDYYYCLNPKKK